MPTGPLGSFLRHFRRRVAPPTTGEVADGDLLARFAHGRDEDAFAVLVARHGPLVLGVCRRVLPDPNDADDAFQATFLVLARKAGSIGQPERLASWLYGVAYRVARKARAQAARRRARQQQVPVMQAPEPDREADRKELYRVLDDEVQRLPERFRAPLVLCYLQGKSREEAASQLGWSASAVKGMLERGRQLLRARLARRGLVMAEGALVAVLSEGALAASVPAALGERTVKAAVLFASGQAAAGSAAVLAEGALQTMWITRVTITVAVVLALGLAGAGAVVLAVGGPSAGPGEAKKKDPPQGAGEKPVAKADRLRQLLADRLTAAKLAYEGHWERFKVGREREGKVHLWSRRWLEAQLELSTSQAERDAARAAYRDRLERADELANSRLRGATIDARPDAFAQEKQLFEGAWQAYLKGDREADEEHVGAMSVRWLMYAHALRKQLKSVDARAELQAHLDRMKELERIARRRFDAGKTAHPEYDAAVFYRLEAEEWLARGRVFELKDLNLGAFGK
jgi:RNA polymerase sigma factor (sigma-70 family)